MCAYLGEDISTEPTHEHRQRMASLHTHTTRGTFYPGVHFELGEAVDVQDSVGHWLKASLIELDQEKKQVKISFVEWGSNYDEWLNMDSYRLAPQYTQTRRPATVDSKVRGLKRQKSSNLCATEDQETLWRRTMSERGLPIQEMAGDGNCLFRSVAHQVYGNPELHTVVRAKVLQYIESQPEYFQSFVDGEEFYAYCTRMRSLGEWGGDIEVQAMSELYSRPIQIYAYSTSPMRIYNQHLMTRCFPIRLSYHFQSHYNSIYTQETSLHCTTSLPGELEEGRITEVLASQARERNHGDRKGGEQVEDEEFVAALRASRLAFNAEQPDDFDQAVQLSLADVGNPDASRIAAALTASQREHDEQVMIDEAKRASLQAADSKQTSEDDALQRAMAESLRNNNEMERALQLSMQGQSNEDTELQRALAQSRQDQPSIEDDELQRVLALSAVHHNSVTLFCLVFLLTNHPYSSINSP